MHIIFLPNQILNNNIKVYQIILLLTWVFASFDTNPESMIDLLVARHGNGSRRKFVDIRDTAIPFPLPIPINLKN